MTEDLGWTRSEFVLASSLGFGIGGLSGFFVGPLIDRYGARPIMLAGATVGGLALVAVSQVESLWQFILVRGALTQVGLFMLGPFVVNTTLSKWFVIKRGRVIALASLGGSLGGVIPPLAFTGIVDRWGWESGWVVMGIVTLVLMLPCSLVMRRQPEDYGLLPDGKTGDEEPTAREIAQLEEVRSDYANSYTRGEAMRTRAMWLLVLGFAARRGGGGVRVLARDPVHDRCRLHSLTGRLRVRRAGRRRDGLEALLGVGDANALSAHPDRAHDRDDGRSVGAAGSGRGRLARRPAGGVRAIRLRSRRDVSRSSSSCGPGPSDAGTSAPCAARGSRSAS